MKTLWMLAVPLMLTGCLSAEQQAANRQRQYAEQEARASYYRIALQDKCREYGFQYNTPEHSQCVMQLDQANQNRQAQQNAAILQGIASQPPAPNPAYIPPSSVYLRGTTPAPVQQTTQCRWIGQVWTCN